ncbi:hypothetical protein G6F63_016813 [Rhizopus arrhizus]|nr:hypothetical protein G6F63_016813 [Rhizopus arrhizus]
MITGLASITTSTCSPMAALTASLPLLNGTCTMSRPAVSFSSSSPRCGELALPADPKFKRAGLALAYATNSLNDAAGQPARTAST